MLRNSFRLSTESLALIYMKVGVRSHKNALDGGGKAVHAQISKLRVTWKQRETRLNAKSSRNKMQGNNNSQPVYIFRIQVISLLSRPRIIAQPASQCIFKRTYMYDMYIAQLDITNYFLAAAGISHIIRRHIYTRMRERIPMISGAVGRFYSLPMDTCTAWCSGLAWLGSLIAVLWCIHVSRLPSSRQSDGQPSEVCAANCGPSERAFLLMYVCVCTKNPNSSFSYDLFMMRFYAPLREDLAHVIPPLHALHNISIHNNLRLFCLAYFFVARTSPHAHKTWKLMMRCHTAAPLHISPEDIGYARSSDAGKNMHVLQIKNTTCYILCVNHDLI